MRTVWLVALVVAALAGCGLNDPYAAPPATGARSATRSGAAAPPARAAGPRREAAPLSSARVFMRGYLPYLYGLGPARAIGAVTPALWRSLAAQPMTREDGASPSQPRLEALRTISQGGHSVRVRAIVSDESRVYFALDLALVRGAGGWRVAALRTNGG